MPVLRAPTRLAAVLTALMFATVAFSAQAAKPQEVMEWSNGFPSGEHFNLNIHGKKAGYQCDPTAGGGSVFVSEHGKDRIDIMQNKRSALTQLVAHDPCGIAFDGDPALVQLPAGEYQVYARILGKPGKDAPASVVLYPSLVDACDDPADGTDFANATECDDGEVVGLGKVTHNGVFDLTQDGLERFDTAGGKGKGKSTATDISPLFQWSGLACDAALDTDGDGQLTAADLNETQRMAADADADGTVTDAELDAYLTTLDACQVHESEWIFNIADLVVYGLEYENHGAKLVQVRFYPTG